MQSVSLAWVTPGSGLVLAEPPLEAFTGYLLIEFTVTKCSRGGWSVKAVICNLVSTKDSAAQLIGDCNTFSQQSSSAFGSFIPNGL